MSAGPPLAIVTTRRFHWIAWHATQEAVRRGRAVESFLADDPGELERLEKAAGAGELFGALFVTIHPLVARGGDAALARLAAGGLPVVVWNVDSPAIVWRTLPHANDAIGIVHVSESDARFWSDCVSRAQVCSFTQGIGPHGQVFEHRPPPLPIAKRPIGVLVPMNLRWCSRTLEEVDAMARALQPGARRVFEHAAESCRADPRAGAAEAVRAALEAEGVHLPDTALRQLVRLVVYHAHLWRRERLLDVLLDQPVTIDSNDLPERLLRGRAPRATLLRESDPRRTVERTALSRAVVSTSFSPDLLHDRPLNAALLGAAALAERNRIFPRWFEDRTSVLYFDYTRESIEAAVETALGDAVRVQEIADAARELVAGPCIDYRWHVLLDAVEWLAERALR